LLNVFSGKSDKKSNIFLVAMLSGLTKLLIGVIYSSWRRKNTNQCRVEAMLPTNPL
jgi:hypothetical protein